MDQQLRVLLTVRKTCPKLKDKTLRYFIRTARWWKCGLFPATLELVWVGHKTITAEGSKLKRDYRLYQRKVDVDILNAVRNVLADVSSVSHCSDEGVTLETLTHILRRSVYPHQPFVDTVYVPPFHRHRPTLVLTETSIPLKRDYTVFVPVYPAL